jgi:hypothetical protein
MKILTTLSLSLCLGSICFADTLTGKLVNAGCQADKPASCELTDTTQAFALQTADGKMLKLDPGGNSQAVQIVRQDPAKAKSGQFRVDGDVKGDTVMVKSIQPAGGPGGPGAPPEKRP